MAGASGPTNPVRGDPVQTRPRPDEQSQISDIWSSKVSLGGRPGTLTGNNLGQTSSKQNETRREREGERREGKKRKEKKKCRPPPGRRVTLSGARRFAGAESSRSPRRALCPSGDPRLCRPRRFPVGPRLVATPLRLHLQRSGCMPDRGPAAFASRSAGGRCVASSSAVGGVGQRPATAVEPLPRTSLKHTGWCA